MRLIALSFLTLLSGSLKAQARLDSSEGEPRIVVSVARTTKLVPDRVTCYLLVEGSGETPADAVQKVTQKLQAVATAVRQSGVAVESMSPFPYGIAPAPNMGGYPNSSMPPSYLARYTIRVHLAKPDQLMQLTATAIAAGATSTSSPVFEASAMDSVRRARYADALELARQDAATLAAALGGKLGKLIEVSSSTFAPVAVNQTYIQFISRFDAGGQAIAPEVQATASVTVRFQFIPK